MDLSIHSPLRPPSANCLDFRPKRRPPRHRNPPRYGPHLPRPARFVDFAVDAAGYGSCMAWNEANAGGDGSSWVAPTAAMEMEAIYDTMNAGRTFQGFPFAGALDIHGRELFVGIVEVADEHVYAVTIPESPEQEQLCMACIDVRVLVAAPSCCAAAPLHLPLEQWELARKKFSLPPGKRDSARRFVPGPYLATAAYEPHSGAIVRIRLWPVWLASDLSRYSIVRSGLELAALAEVAAMGGIGFTSFCKRQVDWLQAGLGQNWAGDISTYYYLPDLILMPQRGYPPILIEIFGIRAMKPYDLSKIRKKTEGAMNRSISFVSIEGFRLDTTSVISQIRAVLADASIGAWRNPLAHSFAAYSSCEFAEMS